VATAQQQKQKQKSEVPAPEGHVTENGGKAEAQVKYMKLDKEQSKPLFATLRHPSQSASQPASQSATVKKKKR